MLFPASAPVSYICSGQKLSPYQKNQTFPAGSDVYPFDRPTLSRQHFEVSFFIQGLGFVRDCGQHFDESCCNERFFSVVFIRTKQVLKTVLLN